MKLEISQSGKVLIIHTSKSKNKASSKYAMGLSANPIASLPAPQRCQVNYH